MKSSRLRLLSWYPRRWRARYGEGMLALLEDAYALGRVPLRAQLGLVVAGLRARVGLGAISEGAVSRGDRLRAGSLSVLSGWAYVVVAGAVFAKFADGWDLRGASPARWAKYGYATAATAGLFGLVVVVLAALVALPSLVRLLRTSGFEPLRRAVSNAMASCALAGGLTLALGIWAHHLSAQERNGGSVPYEVLFVIWAVSAVVAIASLTLASISIGRRLTLSGRELRRLSGAAILLTLAMAGVLAGMVTWWGAEATYAPVLLQNGIGNGVLMSSGTVPLPLVVAGLTMLTGLVVAGRGALGVLKARPARPILSE
jgi:hypothetical protein